MAFGKICGGEMHGTCEDEKIGRDAKDAACKSGDAAAGEEGGLGAITEFI